MAGQQPQGQKQTRVYKEKSKGKSSSQQQRDAEQEKLDEEFNAAADKKAEETRDRMDELDKKTTAVLANIDKVLGL